MKKVFLFVLAIFNIMTSLSFAGDFFDDQKRYSRVRTAVKEKDDLIKRNIKNNGIKLNEMNILIAAYKQEDILELYAKNKSDENYKKIASYTIAAKSGTLGPKRMEGDLQVPEGFYYIQQHCH